MEAHVSVTFTVGVWAKGKRKWSHSEVANSCFTFFLRLLIQTSGTTEMFQLSFLCFFFFNGDALVTDMVQLQAASLISKACHKHAFHAPSRAPEQYSEISGTRPRHDALTNAAVIPSWYVNVFPKMTSRANLSGLPRWNGESSTRTNALPPIPHVVNNTRSAGTSCSKSCAPESASVQLLTRHWSVCDSQALFYV